jgi:hypothetical protein
MQYKLNLNLLPDIIFAPFPGSFAGQHPVGAAPLTGVAAGVAPAAAGVAVHPQPVSRHLYAEHGIPMPATGIFSLFRFRFHLLPGPWSGMFDPKPSGSIQHDLVNQVLRNSFNLHFSHFLDEFGSWFEADSQTFETNGISTLWVIFINLRKSMHGPIRHRGIVHAWGCSGDTYRPGWFPPL